MGGGIKRCFYLSLTSVFCLSVCLSVCLTSVAYIGPKSRTERPRKTKIGTEVAHVTRDSDTTFKARRSEVNLFDGQKRHSVSFALIKPLAQMVFTWRLFYMVVIAFVFI